MSSLKGRKQSPETIAKRVAAIRASGVYDRQGQRFTDLNKSRIGLKQTESSNLKRSKAMKGKQNSLGTVRSLEYKKRLSEYWTDNPNHNNYIDGRHKEKKSERLVAMARLEYREWRKSVFERDNFTCQHCGQKGCMLNADHIKPWSLFPDLRYEIDNGQTLCYECHRKTPTFAGKMFKKKGIKVICSKNGTIYQTIKEAAASIGVDKSTLARRLRRGIPNTTTFKYYNE